MFYPTFELACSGLLILYTSFVECLREGLYRYRHILRLLRCFQLHVHVPYWHLTLLTYLSIFCYRLLACVAWRFWFKVQKRPDTTQ